MRTDPLEGITTTAYRGRQSEMQAIEDAVRTKAEILTRVYARDSKLIVTIFILTLLLIGSVLGNVWQGMTGVQIEPYVVRVDHLGNEQPLIRLTELPVTPEQTVVIGILMSWVEWVRTISEDRVILGQNWAKVEDYTTNAGLKQLEEFRHEQKLRQQLQRRVNITTPRIMPIPKTRSYTVEWQEKAYDENGQILMEESRNWTATT